MPGRPNKTLRLLVPIVLVLIGLMVPVAVLINTTNRQAPKGAAGQAPAPAGEVAEDVAGTLAGADDPAEPRVTLDPDPEAGPDGVEPPAAQAGEPTTVPQGAPLAGLRVESFPGDPLARDFAPLGGLGLDSPFDLRVEFSHLGAGIREILLADEFETVQADREAREGPVPPELHVTVQAQVAGRRNMLVPFLALGLEINGQFVQTVIGPESQPAWRQVAPDAPGHFEAFIVDGEGRRVLRLERRYTLAPASHDVLVEQNVTNLTDRRLEIRWRQFGPIDLFADSGYGGEHRRVRFGYLYSAQRDPTRQFVDTEAFLWNRNRFMGNEGAKAQDVMPVWPNEKSDEEGFALVWAAMTNRYFAAVAHPIIDPTAAQPDKSFDVVERVERVRLDDADAMVLSFHSPVVPVPAGGSAEFDMGLYAGPKSRELIETEPLLTALGVPEIVVYNFGGPCAACTFQWLTLPLLALLRFLHSLTFDWALAIILLVVCVRTVLHPITRWSQIKMLVFGKKMQNIAPKQKILQERYKDDRQRMQQEMAKLWREEGISPTGFLGCLPMFLQSPIWIALYATLFFAIDLRHEPAFFGVFQIISGNAWPFLADLAEPDRAIYFGAGFKLPLVGTINSINLLPVLLGVVFYLQQKYLTPPTSAAMTPEQESQQKMMRVIMVVLFPLIMYGAPSGLSLYFITNSVLGILESRWIRAHATKSGMLEESNLRKKPKKGGFIARLQKLAEQQQQMQAQRGVSPKRVPRQSKPEAPARRYKKR